MTDAATLPASELSVLDPALAAMRGPFCVPHERARTGPRACLRSTNAMRAEGTGMQTKKSPRDAGAFRMAGGLGFEPR